MEREEKGETHAVDAREGCVLILRFLQDQGFTRSAKVFKSGKRTKKGVNKTKRTKKGVNKTEENKKKE